MQRKKLQVATWGSGLVLEVHVQAQAAHAAGTGAMWRAGEERMVGRR